MKKGVIIFLTILLFACNNTSSTPDNEWERDTNTRTMHVTDQPYQLAVQRAQAEIKTFKELFAKSNATHDFFIKTSFSDKNGVEHMWVNVYLLQGDTAYGTIDNDAIKVKNIQFGDSVAIELKSIKDFTVYKGDSIIAGDFLNHELSK